MVEWSSLPLCTSVMMMKTILLLLLLQARRLTVLTHCLTTSASLCLFTGPRYPFLFVLFVETVFFPAYHQNPLCSLVEI